MAFVETADNYSTKTEPKRVRLVSLDVLRGGAVFLVVFHHVLVFLGRRWFDIPDQLATLNWGLGFARMPTLLLLSGFLARGLMRAPGRRIFWRTVNLAWLLLIWTPIILAFKLENGSIHYRDIVREILLPNTELWFLWALNVLAIVPVFVRLGVSKYLLMGIFLLLSVVTWSDYVTPAFFAGEQTGRYGLYFVIGCLLLDVSVIDAIRRRALPIFVGLTSIGLALHLAKAGEGGSLPYALLSVTEALCFGIAAIALVSAIPDEYLLRTRINRLGRNTLPVYVCHIPVILMLAMVDIRVPDSLSTIAAVVITLAVTLLCLVMHRMADASGLAFLFHFPHRSQRWLGDRFGLMLNR